MRRTSAGFLALALLGTPVLGIHSSSAVTTTCFGRPATIVSDAGELVGTERDVIVSGRGFCSISGLDGSDRICDPGDVDEIWGRRGDGHIDAGPGADYVDGGDGVSMTRSGDDVIFGGAGRDSLLGLDGVDRLYGGPGPDTLAGDFDPRSPDTHNAAYRSHSGDRSSAATAPTGCWASTAPTSSAAARGTTSATPARAPTSSAPARWSGVSPAGRARCRTGS